MAKKKLIGFWSAFIFIPLLVIPVAVLFKWGPQIFGVEWFERYGETVKAASGIVMVTGITAIFIIPALGPMFSFFGGGPAERRIRKTGRPARATIIRVGENSGGGVVTVNDQPYLNLVVRVEDGMSAPYEASFNAIIPRAQVPQVQPGAVVMVKVDPRDPRKVVLDY